MKKLLLIFVILFNNSCALMFTGKTQNVTFLPSDSSASVEADVIDGAAKYSVKLPTTLGIKRSNSNLIVNVKENNCYKASQSIHSSSINWVSLVDILLVIFGLFGISSTATDVTSGAVWEYDNNTVVNLVKKDSCKE